MYNVHEFNLSNFVSLISVFVSIIFIIFLLSLKSERRLSNIFLSLWLFFHAQDAASQYTSHFIYPISQTLGMLYSLTTFLLPPLLYLFFKSSVFKDFKVSKKTFLHALPYILINILIIPIYYSKTVSGTFSEEYQELFLESFYYKFIYISLHIQGFIYYLLIIRLLIRYKILLIENYSNPKLNNYKWLLTFVLILIFTSVFAFFKNIFRFYGSDEIYGIAINIVNISMLGFIFWFLIKALRTPGLFSGVYSNLQLVKDIIKENNDNLDKKNVLSESNIEDETIKELRQYMEKEEPFLDSELSVHELAKQIGIPSKKLSIAINHFLNKHFFDFVNEYRINKAKNLLSDPDNYKLTILEILYEVGFNSKSSFNTAFKKHSGMTPSEYRKKNLKLVA